MFTFLHLQFKYTKTDRAKESAEAFTQSLFGDEHKNVVYPEALSADPILRVRFVTSLYCAFECLNSKYNLEL